MSNKKKVVCPKCQAKLKFDPDKVTADVVKFKCPSCGTVLRIKKSTPEPTTESIIRHERKLTASDSDQEAVAELSDLAKKFDREMDLAEKKSQKDSPEEIEDEPGAETSEIIEDETIKVSNSRREKRVKFKQKVLVNNQIMVEALDISERGLFLHTGRSFEDGAIVEVGIPTQPGSFDLKVQAEVRHNHRGIGMGLQFIDVAGKEKMQLKKLISELDKAATAEAEGRKKVLLVGGTDTARNINKSKLVLDGFYVLQAITADEVYKSLAEEPPDAMVVEWQETRFNCKGLLARIKQNTANDAIIRVVLSALTDSQIQQEIIAAGAHKYMAKMDTNPAKLSNILKQLIDERDGTE